MLRRSSPVWPLLLCAAVGCRRGPEGTPDAGPVAPGRSLLGGERGLDHVGIGVKDLAAARRTFHDVLGFGAAEAGRLPNGIENVNYYFEDSTYLETLTAWDPQKARWLAQFTAVREGPVFLALAIASTDGTTAFLAGRGIRTGAPVPGSIQTARSAAGEPPSRWSTMFFDGPVLPANPLFFIAYGQPQRDEMLGKLAQARRTGRIYRHPNGALGVKAVWLAVPELAAAAASFTRAGLPPGRAFEEPRLGARGLVIEAGEGRILLLAPATADGAVATQLRERGGPSLLGVSIEVSRLGVVQGLVARATGQPAPAQAGVLGSSVLVPPAMAHGAWLEFFERGGG